jgi:hypothetical protein
MNNPCSLNSPESHVGDERRQTTAAIATAPVTKDPRRGAYGGVSSPTGAGAAVFISSIRGSR